MSNFIGWLSYGNINYKFILIDDFNNFLVSFKQFSLDGNKHPQTGKWNTLDTGSKQNWNWAAEGVGGNRKKKSDCLFQQFMPIFLDRQTTVRIFMDNCEVCKLRTSPPAYHPCRFSHPMVFQENKPRHGEIMLLTLNRLWLLPAVYFLREQQHRSWQHPVKLSKLLV